MDNLESIKTINLYGENDPETSNVLICMKLKCPTKQHSIHPMQKAFFDCIANQPDGTNFSLLKIQSMDNEIAMIVESRNNNSSILSQLKKQYIPYFHLVRFGSFNRTKNDNPNNHYVDNNHIDKQSTNKSEENDSKSNIDNTNNNNTNNNPKDDKVSYQYSADEESGNDTYLESASLQNGATPTKKEKMDSKQLRKEKKARMKRKEKQEREKGKEQKFFDNEKSDRGRKSHTESDQVKNITIHEKIRPFHKLPFSFRNRDEFRVFYCF